MKLVYCLFPAVVLLFFSSPSLSITSVAKQGFEDETAKAKVHQDRIKRSTEFVKEIRGDVLYTEHNSYSLQNVTVVDQTKGTKEKRAAGRKRIAELVFVNDVLREVVIHP